MPDLPSKNGGGHTASDSTPDEHVQVPVKQENIGTSLHMKQVACTCSTCTNYHVPV